jgi:hypothetical protein
MNKVRDNTILLTVTGVIGIIIIIYFFKETDKTIPNYATVIGTFCSVIGMTIAYINIIALKNSSIEISIKINQALQKVNQLDSISEISKAIKTNQEIQNFIRSGKIESAHLRTLDLKYILLRLNNNPHLTKMVSSENYIESVIEFGIDLNSISDNLISPKRKVDFSKITRNLEELSTHLTQFESQLKSINI